MAPPAGAARAPTNLRATQSSQAQPAPGTSERSPGAQTPGQSTKQAPGQAPGSTQGAPSSTTEGATSHGSHFVTVKFDYDFSKTPACSVTVKAGCVQEFVAYDISGGVNHRIKLFEIPLPPEPVGVVSGIPGKSPTKLDFESGKHLLSVVAREPDGRESRHLACTTWIEIP
jgi:hypothetical protein